MAEQSIDQLIDRYAPEDVDTEMPGEDESLEQYFESRDQAFEWVIPPDQFVDFWVAAVFLLVGTWQVITIFFLLVS